MARPKILVVEDFEKFRQFVVSTLREKTECLITQSSDGLEAVQQAAEQKPDLVLLDIGLPSLNGMEVARRLRRLAIPPKIVFVSQESSPEIVREALDHGALGYVHKLSARTDLLPAIEAALLGRRFVSSGLLIGEGTNTQARHEILFCSDTAALLNAFADFVGNALKSGNPVLVGAIKSREYSFYQELKARGVEIDAAIQRGTYAFLDIDTPPDLTRTRGFLRRLSEAASREGKEHPRVAVWGERAGRKWADGEIDEAIRLEQLANQLATHQDIDILCPYPLPHGEEDHSAFKKVCAEHSVVSYR
jgi:DNA-binding NarL/FixJ family response regulator